MQSKKKSFLVTQHETGKNTAGLGVQIQNPPFTSTVTLGDLS